MSALSLFGLFAVTAMLLGYALEQRSRCFILAFAEACAFGLVEAVLVRRGGAALVAGAQSTDFSSASIVSISVSNGPTVTHPACVLFGWV